jgi:hypothetical protein
MIGRRCAACFSFDEGMPRTHVSFRTRAKKAFSHPFSSVARRARTRSGRPARLFSCLERAECADCLRVALDTKLIKWAFSHAKRTIARNYVSNARFGRVRNRESL